MYVLQGAKCGSVRFEPFVNGVINKETVSRQSTITDNPIEGGGSINDHVFRSPLSFQLSGTVTDGAAGYRHPPADVDEGRHPDLHRAEPNQQPGYPKPPVHP